MEMFFKGFNTYLIIFKGNCIATDGFDETYYNNVQLCDSIVI